jgi:hypothetical protein
MLEAGLGVIAACLPVQYGLLKSEKLQSIIRSIHSLTSLASRAGSNDSFSPAQSRAQSQRLDGLNGSQISDVGAALPANAAATAYSDVRMEQNFEGQGIVVSKSFGTEEQAV